MSQQHHRSPLFSKQGRPPCGLFNRSFLFGATVLLLSFLSNSNNNAIIVSAAYIDCTPTVMKFSIDLSRYFPPPAPTGCYWTSQNFGNRPCWAAPSCPQTPINFDVTKIQIYQRDIRRNVLKQDPQNKVNIKTFRKTAGYDTGDVFLYQYKPSKGKKYQIHVEFSNEQTGQSVLNIFGLQTGCDTWPSIYENDAVANIKFLQVTNANTEFCPSVITNGDDPKQLPPPKPIACGKKGASCNLLDKKCCNGLICQRIWNQNMIQKCIKPKVTVTVNRKNMNMMMKKKRRNKKN